MRDLLLAKDSDGVFPLALLARADNMEDVWQYINSKYDGNDTEVFDRFNYDLLLFIACAADNYDLCNFFLTVNKDLQSNSPSLFTPEISSFAARLWNYFLSYLDRMTKKHLI